ncbi:hypothetical protein L218DRAFT_955711 [Marasmius fiardii PR-910]|nr:hypothetical protein L218DRAFT_955711 [Marasmius fiardii PR-910]
MLPTCFLLLFVLNILGLALQAGAQAGNRTIDDSSTDLRFTGAWSVNSCPECDPQPESGQAHNGTWHASSDKGATVQLQFRGSAIWVYGILPPAATRGSLTITLGLNSPVVYNSSGNTDSSFIYNELLFAASSLSNFTHSLTLKTAAGSDSGHSVLIDYVVVSEFPTSTSSTTDAPSGGTSSEFNLVKILAPSGGGFLGLSILIWILRCWWHC